MIQYIIAAGIGAFLGSQSKKSKKSYAEGGEIGKYRWYEIDYFDENDMPSGQSLTFKNDEDANRHAENFTIRKDLKDFKVTRTDEIADEDYTDSYPIMSWKKMAKGGYLYQESDDRDAEFTFQDKKEVNEFIKEHNRDFETNYKSIDDFNKGEEYRKITKSYAKGGKMQGYNARGDEELGMTDGKESRFKQSKKERRDEMKGENRSARNKTYGSF